MERWIACARVALEDNRKATASDIATSGIRDLIR